MTEFSDNSQGSGGQEIDVDAILAQAYGHENPSQNQVQEQKPAAPPEPQFKEYEFNHRGQAIKIKENDPRFTQWMSQGYDYAQNIQAMKSEREEFERSRKEWEQRVSPYREIDQFAKENPDWWNHIEQSYQQRLSTPVEVPDAVRKYLDQRLEPVTQDIPLMKEYLQKQQKLEIEKQQAEEDAQLGNAIKSIQEKYKDLDFSAKDESGLSLEQRVLNHAMQNGIPTFKAAFLDYYHESIEKLAEARGKEAFMQEMNKRKRLGLLDDPAPGKSNVPLTRKPVSWNDPQLSAEQILKEFNF